MRSGLCWCLIHSFIASAFRGARNRVICDKWTASCCAQFSGEMATLESQSGDGDYSMLMLRVGLGTLLTTSLLTLFLLRFPLHPCVGCIHLPFLTQSHLLFLPWQFLLVFRRGFIKMCFIVVQYINIKFVILTIFCVSVLWLIYNIVLVSGVHQSASVFIYVCVCVWYVSSVQLFSHVQLFVTPWTAAHQASLSIANSWSLLKLMSI